MTLKRPLSPMPGFVRDALETDGLMPRYEARRAYERNDYLRWIAAARREETRQKRLAQMPDELRRGGVCMNMAWSGG